MTILHTINKSPFENNALSSCLRFAKDDSAILFIEDAVYAAMQDTRFSYAVTSAMKNIHFYVLGEDLSARGMNTEKIIHGITVVDYTGFVTLVADHDTNQSWL